MRHPRDNARTTAAGIGLGLLLFAAPGCQLAGVMAASNERYGSHDVDAAYTGLWDKSFAVVAWADRAMQAEYPALVPSLIERIDLILAAESGASGHIPGNEVTAYLANNPQWVAWPRGRLNEELGDDGVDRVVLLEINEFRTNDPGNEYLWAGQAWATLSVIERGAEGSDAEAFRKEIRVTFPDGKGYGPEDMTKQMVASTLLKRLVDRAAWTFYDHEEPNSLEY
jgi:hypothetical protein